MANSLDVENKLAVRLLTLLNGPKQRRFCRAHRLIC
jgi:hypothetical protein